VSRPWEIAARVWLADDSTSTSSWLSYSAILLRRSWAVVRVSLAISRNEAMKAMQSLDFRKMVVRFLGS
jgi:hypothetical protein